MTKYLIKGKIKDDNSAPIADLYLQAMDSDQQLFEDHNDDLLGSSKSISDGSFEIPIEESTFKDNWLEKSPEASIGVAQSMPRLAAWVALLTTDPRGSRGFP